LPIDSPNEQDDAIAAAAALASAYSNPGPFEAVNADAKRLIMLDTHDGFRCEINKQLSPYMAVIHSFWLGTNMLPDGRTRTYAWLTQVADEKSLYMARIDPERQSVDGRIHRAVLGGLAMSKLVLSLSPEGQTDQCMIDLDFSGLSWTGNVKYGSAGGGVIYGCNYLQAVTPKFCMGGEGMYVSANQSLVTSYVAKCTIPAMGDEVHVPKNLPPGAPPPEEPSSTFIGMFNTMQGTLSLNYKRVVTPNRVTLGAELNCNPFSLESDVTLGAEFKWSRSRLQVSVDGNAKMSSLLETPLGKEPGQPKLHLSADLDHMKDEMRFGYGLHIDG
jgi:mitochondrial import receptor subunit TOM40